MCSFDLALRISPLGPEIQNIDEAAEFDIVSSHT